MRSLLNILTTIFKFSNRHFAHTLCLGLSKLFRAIGNTKTRRMHFLIVAGIASKRMISLKHSDEPEFDGFTAGKALGASLHVVAGDDPM